MGFAVGLCVGSAFTFLFLMWWFCWGPGSPASHSATRIDLFDAGAQNSDFAINDASAVSDSL
jgi:hypothetical protein